MSGRSLAAARKKRRVFSGIVAGKFRHDGMRPVEQFGRFEIHGDPDSM